MARLGLACLLVLISSVVSAAELKSEDLYEKVVPSVMTLTVEKVDGSTAVGTGFLAIKDGLALTAWHVVLGARRVTAKFSSGEEFESPGLVDKDERRDLALIRIKVSGRPALLLSATIPAVASRVYVIGAPKGLGFTVSDGLISQVRATKDSLRIQFSCPASPGSSGGPLVNVRAQAVGVVSRQEPTGQNLNFAVPAVYAQGLDSTLPTKLWENVKPESPPAEASVAVIDDILGRSAVTGHDMYVVYVYSSAMWGAPGGYKKPVPSDLYRLERAAGALETTLATLAPTDSLRCALCARMRKEIKGEREALHLLREGVRQALKDKGWSSLAADLASRAHASFDAARQEVMSPETTRQLGSTSVPFQNAIPKEIQTIWGIVPDPAGFKLGVRFLSSKPLLFLGVMENGLAHALGFRDGDRILYVEGAIPSSLTSFKMRLKQSVGKTLRVVVLRDDGTRMQLRIAVPTELPENLGKE